MTYMDVATMEGNAIDQKLIDAEREEEYQRQLAALRIALLRQFQAPEPLDLEEVLLLEMEAAAEATRR